MAPQGPLGAGAGGLGDLGPVGLGVQARAADGRRKEGAELSQAWLWGQGSSQTFSLALQD